MTVKITRTIHHGDYRSVETAQGETLVDALTALPATTYDTRPARERATAIEDHRRIPGYPGPYQWGWCDYDVTVGDSDESRALNVGDEIIVSGLQGGGYTILWDDGYDEWRAVYG